MTQAQVKKEDKLFNIYYNTIESCKMIADKGEVIVFVKNRCITDNAIVIEYLDREIRLGHPHLSVKKGEEQKLASDLDPEIAKKKKIIAEYLAEQEAAGKAPPAVNPVHSEGVKTPVDPQAAKSAVLEAALEKARKQKEALAQASSGVASSVDLSQLNLKSNS